MEDFNFNIDHVSLSQNTFLMIQDHNSNQGAGNHYRIIINTGWLNDSHAHNCAGIAIQVIQGFSKSQLVQFIGYSNRKTILYFDSDGTLAGFISFQILVYEKVHKYAAIHFIATRYY